MLSCNAISITMQMGFKKEKLLSGLLAKKPSDLKDLQKEKPKQNSSVIDRKTKALPSPLLDKITGAQDSRDTCTNQQEGTSNHASWKDIVGHKDRRLDTGDLINSKCAALKTKHQPLSDTSPHSCGGRPCSKEDIGVLTNKLIPPEHCHSLELASEPDTEVEVNSITNLTNTSEKTYQEYSDSNKLSIIFSHSIPLSTIATVSSAQTEGPSTSTTSVIHHRKPKHDHDYCVQAFDDTNLNYLCDGSYCVSDYSLCHTTSPNIVWGLEYEPIVASYQGQPIHDCSVSSLEPVAWDACRSSCCQLHTKQGLSALQKIGLTRINLEKLADTGSISESLFLPEKSSTDKRNDRICQRSKMFVHTMQDNHSKKQKKCLFPHPVMNNQVVERWLKLQEPNLEEMNSLLEDTTDILYCWRGKPADYSTSVMRNVPHHGISLAPLHYHARQTTPVDTNSISAVRRQLPADGVMNLPPDDGVIRRHMLAEQSGMSVRRQLQYGVSGSSEPARCQYIRRTLVAESEPPLPSKPPKIHHKIRQLFAKSLASTKSNSKLLSDTRIKTYEGSSDDHANPPVWERSRSVTSICSRHNSAMSLLQGAAHCSELEGEGKREKYSNTKAIALRNGKKSNTQTTIKTLRSRTINIFPKMKHSVKKLQGGVQGSTAPSLDDTDEGSMLSLEERTKDWIMLSEQWMNTALDKATILTLFNDS